MKFDKILITTDFSDESIRAFDFSAHEVKMEGARLTLLYVFDEYFIPPTVIGHMPNPQRIIEDSKQASLEKLENLAEKHFHGLDIEVKLVSTTDSAADAICDFAKENNFNLIVMSSHGRSGFQKFFIGSVADKVIRKSHCPVLVVPKNDIG